MGEGGWLTAVFFVRVDGWPSGCGRATDSSFFFSQGFRQWMTDATPTCDLLQLLQHIQDWHIIFKEYKQETFSLAFFPKKCQHNS